MSQISSLYGNLPGMGTVVETYEAAFTWGPPWRLIFTNGWIDANAIDSGNTPTYKLRPGLVMGKIGGPGGASPGRWTNYNAAATDGSQIAAGVLVTGLRMQDVLSGLNTQKFYSILTAGGVQAAKLLGLDNLARAQMATWFQFDDNLTGTWQFEFLTFVAKTANYQILSTDNMTEFNNTGATTAVTFTLPPIAPGLKFGFRVVANQNLSVTSTEGANIVAFNNASANTVAYSTVGQLIGGGFKIYSNQTGTKWEVEDTSAGTNTITVS
jgi:hypothetical protein